MSINFESALGIHEQALKLRTQRTEILANNIANSDTPGFKARDIDFAGIMKKTSMKQTMKSGLKTTRQGHISGASPFTENLMFKVPSQPSMDGNTVDANAEKAAFAKNQMAFNASFRFLSGRIKGVISAIRGD